MGEDDVVVSRLLHYGSQFAHRSVLHSHQAELTGCFRREDSNHFIDGKTVHASVHAWSIDFGYVIIIFIAET